MPEEKKSYDPNMELALLLAQSLGPAPALPNSLTPVDRRAEFINIIDGSLVIGLDLGAVVARLGSRMREIAELSADYIPEISDSLLRVNIALRLWSGCLFAAKTIALETRSGPNTPEMRAQIMEIVDRIAATDEIYAAGVEAAPTFKRIRDQGFSFDGVPANSRVRRYS